MDEIRVGFPTDEHHPFSDPLARNVALQIVADFDPHTITAGSDALDFYSVSSFQKDKKVYGGSFQDEINAWKKAQAEWNDAAPNANRLFILGNHEARLRKRLLVKAPEFASLNVLELQKLLDFEGFGLRMAKNNEIVISGKLVIKHGDVVRKHSAYTAKAEMEKEMHRMWVMSGHTHRGGVHYSTPPRGDFVASFECFCLCDLNPSYVKNPNWQQGIVLATVTDDMVDVEPIPFFRKKGKVLARWRGKEYIDS